MATKTKLLVATLVLGTAAWSFFYVAPGSEPLTAPETLVVVGVAALLVLALHWLWGRLRRRRVTQPTAPDGSER